jgi:LEA14-like dessication related protein
MSSCTSIEEPTLDRIEDVEIITLNKSKVEINANMVLKNPNGFALDLDKAELIALIDDIELATIDQTYETNMPANGEFKMPVYINMDLDKLYNDNPLAALGKGLQIMSARKLDVKFQGTIKVGKGMAKVSVKVDQIENVSF